MPPPDACCSVAIELRVSFCPRRERPRFARTLPAPLRGRGERRATPGNPGCQRLFVRLARSLPRLQSQVAGGGFREVDREAARERAADGDRALLAEEIGLDEPAPALTPLLHERLDRPLDRHLGPRGGVVVRVEEARGKSHLSGAERERE